MKKSFVIMAAGITILFATACSNERGRYLDLRTGEKVELEKDDETGLMVNAETRQPVYIYVDTRNNDTIYGKTGDIINGHVVTRNNVYWYDVDLEEEDYKVKSDGDYKFKSDDYKYKVDEDGDIKIKTDDKKIKIDGETGERKVKND